MRTKEIEVMCQHYMGILLIEPVYEDNSLFSVYHKHEFLGHIQPVRKQDGVEWYSHEITDRELVAQAGEWAAYHFPLTDKSFKRIYDFKFFTEFMTGIFAFIVARFTR
jgi:hypothetical protein